MITVFHTVAFSIWALILAIVIIYSRKSLFFSIIMFFGNNFDNFMPNKGGTITNKNKLKIDLKV